MNKRKKTLGYADLNVFCEQIALVLKAGISVYEGICILQEEASSALERELYKGIATSMDEGVSFPDALEESEAFPSYMTHMISIGELSGRLDTVLDQLAIYYKREQAMKDAIRHAVAYPMVMMVMMGIVIAVLVAKVLPIFQSVFKELGSELTGFSKTVMDMGTALSNSLGVILIVIVLVFVAAFLASRTEVGAKQFQLFKTKFFLTRKLTHKIAVSRFAAGMSLMLASGLDTDQSLEMVLPLLDSDEITQKVEAIREQIAGGQNFAEAVSEQQIFSQTYNRMLGIGYRTGSTDEVIENISKRYESEIETMLSNLIAIIEPSLVAVLSIVVGMILLAVMLPLMSIMSVI
ncbi:MAG: type II secretion system F family protein [Lachnospiraceae bacterium]